MPNLETEDGEIPAEEKDLIYKKVYTQQLGSDFNATIDI
jgi:hypothetical protein